jgi:hypothetical protein
MQQTTSRKIKRQPKSTKDPQTVRLGDLQAVFVAKDEETKDSGKVKLGDLQAVF